MRMPCRQAPKPDRGRTRERRAGAFLARAGALCCALLGLTGLAPAQQSVTGTWHDAAGGTVLQVHERADGTLLAYLPGGVPVVTGQERGGAIHFLLETGHVEQERVDVAHGTVSGNTMTLKMPGGPVTLTRTVASFAERRFLMFPLAAGNPDMEHAQLIRVAEGSGGFVTGSFEALTFCDPFACDGDLLSFYNLGGTQVQFDMSWGGPCAGIASIDTSFDASTSFFTGTYDVTDCSGDASGDIALAAWHRTDTAHVAGIFAALGALADDMESGSGFSAPHASIDASFLHFSLTEGDLRGDLGTQSATWSGVDVQLKSFETIHTATDPYAHPLLVEPFSARHRDERGGADPATGVRRVFRDTVTDRNEGELSVVANSAGTWKLTGNQDAEAGGISLPFAPADIRFDLFGWWAYGAHGGGHPEGHPGIDFELDGSTTLVAVRSGTITGIVNNNLTPDQVNVSLDVNGLEIKYQHVDATLAPGITVGASVTLGQAIGSPGEYCCDPVACCTRNTCAPGGESACCATNYPGLGACDPGSNPDYHHLIHFGTVEKIDSACPWDVMTPAARAELESFALPARYAEELTEPFVCNDPQRNADAMPYVTRWEKTTTASAANPLVVEMSRPATYDTHEFRFLDALGTVLRSGLACPGGPENPTEMRFRENAADCWSSGPGVIETLAFFTIDATRDDGTLQLAIGSAPADSYRAVPVDQGSGCPDAEVTGFMVAKAAPGPGLDFTWTDDAAYSSYVVLESSTPDGAFEMPAATGASGVGGASADVPGSVTYFQVAGRDASCGLGPR